MTLLALDARVSLFSAVDVAELEAGGDKLGVIDGTSTRMSLSAMIELEQGLSNEIFEMLTSTWVLLLPADDHRILGS